MAILYRLRWCRGNFLSQTSQSICGDNFGAPIGAGTPPIDLARPTNFTATPVDLVAADGLNPARNHGDRFRPDVNLRRASDSLIGKAAPVDPRLDACQGESGVGVQLPKRPEPISRAFFGKPCHTSSRRRITINNY
jgi:hypothetical protein